MASSGGYTSLRDPPWKLFIFVILSVWTDCVMAFGSGKSVKTSATCTTTASTTIVYATLKNNNNEHDSDFDQQKLSSQYSSIQRRRDVLAALSGVSVALLPVLPSNAGEVGAKITKAVTQSDLGISVRTQVVKGAQVMDKIDGQWEQLSDRFGLGSERSKQPGKPQPKDIPEPLPLDAPTAISVLSISDEVFLSLMPMINRAQLEEQIGKVAALVKPSFLRSNEKLDLGDNDKDPRDVKTADQFNFASYVHFKAYSDLVLKQGKGFDFNAFRRKYELQAGQRLASLLVPQVQKPSTKKTEELLNTKLKQIDQLCDTLKAKGFVSLTERSPLDQEQFSDWLEDTSDLSFTIAIDRDITLGAQMLLQEQGFRLYPDYPRFVVSYLLQNIDGQEISIDDYYFDTDYNSDPEKFEVKEVVLNIVLDSAS